MEVVLLVVGDRDTASSRSVLEPFRTVAIPDRPERSELDAALEQVRGARLAVAASDAGLGVVVRRLLHRDELSGTPLGVLDSPGVRERYGLTGDPVRAVLAGSPVPAGLVRDDHSGVALSGARLLPVDREFGIRAYVEEHELVNRRVREFAVRPGTGALSASVSFPGWRRGRSRTGRAVTVSCEQARLEIDGREQPRTETRRTWWYEPDRWFLYR